MFVEPTAQDAWMWNGNTFPTKEAALKSEFKYKLKTDYNIGDGTADTIVKNLDNIHGLFHEYQECLEKDNHPASTVTPARKIQEDDWKWD